MEDILASIRRILNEDEAPAAAQPPPPAAAPPPEAPPPAAPEPEDVLILDPSMMVEAPHMAEPEPARAAPAAPHAAPRHEPEPQAAPPPEPARPEAAGKPEAAVAARPGEGLVAPEAAAVAANAVGGLMRRIIADRATRVHRNGPSLEDLVREELRPLLKEWLDTHLPPLVERLVHAEIERLTARALEE